MTTWNHVHSFRNPEWSRYFVGADRILDRLAVAQEETRQMLSNYPPYNISKVDENRYLIEMAVAGFGKQDLEVELKGDKLEIRGASSADSEGENNFLFRGIASRAFRRTFKLDDAVEIHGATLLNGMLRIWLEAVIPESKKPRKIEVKEADSEPSTKRKAKAEFLQD